MAETQESFAAKFYYAASRLLERCAAFNTLQRFDRVQLETLSRHASTIERLVKEVEQIIEESGGAMETDDADKEC